MPKIVESIEELDNLPEVVYKYRNWENRFHKTILTHRQVFFAAPKSFEDPLDCKNPIRYDLLTEEDIFGKYYNYSLQFNPSFDESQHRKYAQKWTLKSPIKDPQHLEQMTNETFELYNERFGVLSLTANPASIRMWDKYSNGHRGFCIGFRPEIMFAFLGGGGPVNYVDELPIILPTPKHSMEQQHELQVFFKLKKWEFEEEYRTHKFRKNPLTDQERTVELPPEAYSEIIIGANMSEEIEEELRNSVPDELSTLTIRRLQLINGELED